jgi:predicted AAA+ superfamily ATPase
MRMRTMSLAESGDSSGEVSLSRLFEGGDAVISRSDVDLERLAFLVCRGGWPQALIGSERVMLQQARDYLDSVAEVDMSELDGTRRDPLLVRALLRSYARMSASQASLPQITADVIEGLGRGSASTVERYVAALQALFVIEDLKSWNPNLRSKTAIRTSDTRHLVDPAIAAAALGAGPKDLINDLSTFGLLFESLCVRDLRVYAQALGGDVFHYRDQRGLECDAVIHLRDGRYGLIEVKLGGDKLIEEGASSLHKLRDEIDVEKMPAPSFLMVLTGVGDFSYPREDDVFVVPIATLGV